MLVQTENSTEMTKELTEEKHETDPTDQTTLQDSTSPTLLGFIFIIINQTLIGSISEKRSTKQMKATKKQDHKCEIYIDLIQVYYTLVSQIMGHFSKYLIRQYVIDAQFHISARATVTKA